MSGVKLMIVTLTFLILGVWGAATVIDALTPVAEGALNRIDHMIEYDGGQ